MHALSLSVSKPSRSNGNKLAYFREHLGEQPLLAYQQRSALGPPGGDIGHDQGLDEAAARARAGMRNQVRLDEAGWRVLPVGEGPHRHAAANGGGNRRAAPRLSSRSPSYLRESGRSSPR